MSPKPRRASKQEIENAIKQVREVERLHNWNPQDALLYFAYFLPESVRFTSSDAEEVARVLNLGITWGEYELESRRCRDNGLERDTVITDTLWSFFRVGPAQLTRYYFMSATSRRQYADEISRYRASPEPEKRDVSEKLREYAANVSDEQEKEFLSETMSCLETKAYRAAIVMGWNLAYFHLRRWVVASKLTEFNAELTTRNKSKSKTYDAVNSVADFPEGEAFVIDVCSKANLFPKDRLKTLQTGLVKRNLYAHPSTAKASPAIAAGHIADLLVHIVLDPHFF